MGEGEVVMTVASMLTDVGTIVSTVVTTISGNAVLSAFLGLGLVGAGASLFKRIKKASR